MYLKCLLDKSDTTCQGWVVHPGGGCPMCHVAVLLFDMIRVSHRFENYLSHEKGIGKIFDQILEYPKDAHSKACLHKSIWIVIGNYLENGIDDNEDIDFIDIVKNIGTHLMSGAYTKIKEIETSAKVTEDGDGADQAADNGALLSEE